MRGWLRGRDWRDQLRTAFVIVRDYIGVIAIFAAAMTLAYAILA